MYNGESTPVSQSTIQRKILSHKWKSDEQTDRQTVGKWFPYVILPLGKWNNWVLCSGELKPGVNSLYTLPITTKEKSLIKAMCLEP